MPMVPGAFETPSVRVGGAVDANASPADFGAQVGQSLQQVGGQLADTSNDLQQVQQRQVALVSDAQKNAAYNTQMQQTNKLLFGDPSSGTTGFYDLHGQHALDAAKGIGDQISQIQQDASATIQNPLARQQFEQESRRFVQYSMQGIGSHYAKESQNYADQTDLASEDTAIQSAGLYANDDNGFNGVVGDGTDALIRRLSRNGASGEVIQDQVNNLRSKAWTERVMATATRDPVAAQSIVDDPQSALTGDARQMLTERLRPQVYAYAAPQAAAALALADGSHPAYSANGGAPATSLSGALAAGGIPASAGAGASPTAGATDSDFQALLARANGARAAPSVQAQVAAAANVNAPGSNAPDPRFTQAVQAHILQQNAQAQRAQEQADRANESLFQSAAMGNPLDPANRPPTTLNALLATSPQLQQTWGQLSPKAQLGVQEMVLRNARGANNPAPTPESAATVAQLKGMAARDPSGFQSVNLLDPSYADMPLADRKSLMTMQQTAKPADNAAAVESVMRAVGPDLDAAGIARGKPGSPQAKAYDQVYGNVVDALTKNGKSPAEMSLSEQRALVGPIIADAAKNVTPATASLKPVSLTHAEELASPDLRGAGFNTRAAPGTSGAQDVATFYSRQSDAIEQFRSANSRDPSDDEIRHINQSLLTPGTETGAGWFGMSASRHAFQASDPAKFTPTVPDQDRQQIVAAYAKRNNGAQPSAVQVARYYMARRAMMPSQPASVASPGASMEANPFGGGDQ